MYKKADKDCNKPNIYLVITSLLFIIPVILTLYNKQWLASSACIFILVASTLHHSTKIPEFTAVDKIACFYLALVSLYYGFHYNILYVVLPPIVYISLIYYYGYSSNSMVWCEDYTKATLWHSTIHIFSALSITYASYLLGNIKNEGIINE